MLHGEVQRVDAAEIFGVEHMLRADAAAGRRAEIGLEHGQHRLQHRDAGQAHRGAALVDHVRKLLVDDRVEHDARLLLDVLEHLRQLLFGADQRIDVLDRARVLVLRRSRAAGGEQRLAGGVRDQMQVEEALRFVHNRLGQPVECCGQSGPEHPAGRDATVSDGRFVHNSLRGGDGGLALGISAGTCPHSSISRRAIAQIVWHPSND